jgi:hypothetical protein
LNSDKNCSNKVSSINRSDVANNEQDLLTGDRSWVTRILENEMSNKISIKTLLLFSLLFPKLSLVQALHFFFN